MWRGSRGLVHTTLLSHSKKSGLILKDGSEITEELSRATLAVLENGLRRDRVEVGKSLRKL